jgi:uncharacterized membrane protein YidH (DUF202 family)
MKTFELTQPAAMEPLQSLVTWGDLSMEQLRAAWEDASFRGVELENVLRHEHNIPRRRLLEAMAEFYGCPWIEYDERRPVPPGLLEGLDADELVGGLWFPAIKEGQTVILAAHNPRDPAVLREARRRMPAAQFECRVALVQDIAAFIEDFVNAPPQHLIGNERTGLAFWRNTMARWRTRLACYRTDFAMARTHFSLLRGGLGLITIGRTLQHLGRAKPFFWLYGAMIAAGFGLVLLGLLSYRRIKKSIVRPPRHSTLVEVSAATLYFLENYQYAEKTPVDAVSKQTMLARLSDLLPNCCVYIDSSLDNKVRSYLAHQRNTLAAQRTILACYRTIYARARTGLSFIRTGVSFASIGIGLIGYFGLGIMTLLDAFLILAGVLMAVDGALWYWPVRKEQCEAGKCAIIA